MVHRESVSHIKCRDTNQQGVLIATTKMLVLSAKSWCHDNSARHSLYFIFLFTFLLGGEYFHGDAGNSVAAAALVISKRLTIILSSMV